MVFTNNVVFLLFSIIIIIGFVMVVCQKKERTYQISAKDIVPVVHYRRSGLEQLDESIRPQLILIMSTIILTIMVMTLMLWSTLKHKEFR